MAETYEKWRREMIEDFGAIKFWINQYGNKTIHAVAWRENGVKAGTWNGENGYYCAPLPPRKEPQNEAR